MRTATRHLLAAAALLLLGAGTATAQQQVAMERDAPMVGGQAMPRSAKLTFMMNGERNIVVRDAKGDVADSSTYDVNQSNGMIHVVDKGLLPG